MYKLIINEGLGFTETIKDYETIKEVTDEAVKWDNVSIYKGIKLLLKLTN